MLKNLELQVVSSFVLTVETLKLQFVLEFDQTANIRLFKPYTHLILVTLSAPGAPFAPDIGSGLF